MEEAMVILYGKNGTYEFDPQDVDSLLGEGGMGKVYLGINIDLGQRVAVKKIYYELSQNPTLVNRAMQEAQVQIDHPNVLRMLDFVEQGGHCYVVSEYLEGNGLDEVIRMSGGMYESRALEIVLGVLTGLSVLHRWNPPIIHRDIKPSNIFLCTNGTVKIMDFGIVKISDGKRKSLTGLGMVVGTPYYSAPEQVRSEQQKIGPWTDVYAVGITLFELLSGRLPFDADSEYATLKMQVEQPLPSHARINPDLFRLLSKATSKVPGERYPTADSFKEAIGEYVEGKKSRPRQPRAKTVYVTKSGVWKPLGLVFGFLLVVATIVLAFSWADSQKAKQEILDLDSKQNSLKKTIESSGRAFPFKITEIQFRNVGVDKKILSDYGDRLVSRKMRYLEPKVRYESFLPYEKTCSLKVKVFYPSGGLKRGSKSPEGFSFGDVVKVRKKGKGFLYLSGWGNPNTTTYKAGNYRYEVWYDGQCLGSTTVPIAAY